MPEVGAYEAKIHLPKLLERVEKSECFVITRRGRPVAQTPIAQRDPEASKAIADLREFRKTHSLNGLSGRELIHEGRQYSTARA